MTAIAETKSRVDPLALVDYLHEMMRTDFEETERQIPKWLSLTDQNQVRGYLEKLLTQVKIAIRVLDRRDKLDQKGAQKLVDLWKCAKRPDVLIYFRHKEEGGSAPFNP